MNYLVLADTAGYYKEDKGGISTMCKAMEDMITDEKKEIALRLIEAGKEYGPCPILKTPGRIIETLWFGI